MNWSPAQVASFAWFTTLGIVRSLIILARAGCGKTTTIVEGVKRYTAACLDAKRPIRVLVTSFGKKIVAELTDRLGMLESVGVQVRSLNSLGNSFCRSKVGKMEKDNRAWNLARAVWPKASDQALACLAKLHTKARALLPLATCGDDLIQLAERFDLGPCEELLAKGLDIGTLCDAAYECMLLAAESFHEYDYADQTYLPLRNNWTRPLFDRIVIDETQDMDPAQLMLIQRCLRKDGAICVVGDDMQAIYGFRGADTTAIARLQSELNADAIRLTITRRCPKSHVALAIQLDPCLSDFVTSDDAPEGVITTNLDIASMVDSATPGDFIISRTNAPLVPLCLTLLRKGIRAYVAGRDVGATLIGIIKRIKATDINDLGPALAKHTAKKASKIQSDKRASNPEWLTARLDTVNDESETIMAIAEGCLTIAEVVSRLSNLFTESSEQTMPSVMLTTVHKVKGLESATTYICDGTFRAESHDDIMIRYVAITRSKNAMHFVTGFEKPVEAVSIN